jgi:hypothetical protein
LDKTTIEAVNLVMVCEHANLKYEKGISLGAIKKYYDSVF